MVATSALALVAAVTTGGAALAAHSPRGHVTATTANTFASGDPQGTVVGASGCATNPAGEPSIHVSKDNLVGLGSENGIGGGSQFWSGTQLGGSSSASACALTYDGQPNAVSGIGASGGDIDTAFAPTKSAAGTYRIYAASLNLASVNVATSNDNGKTWSQTPVQGGLPLDDREWIAAYGADTSLLSYHDIATNNIDVLRSDNGGQLYTHQSQAIPPTDYKAKNNQHGNLVIDHHSGTGTSTSPFWAYQSFVAPSTSSGSSNNEAFLAVSSDGGSSWTDRAIPCSTSWGGSLDHQFPNVSVAPNGTLWYAASNAKGVYTATSSDHGTTWTCSGPVSTSSSRAIQPWLVATDSGVDLVYYGAGSGTSPTWSVYFVQNTAGTAAGWGAPTKLMDVHQGDVCESGATCTTGRQLFDDFGVDTDQSGWAHIAYSHDAPALGGSSTSTGYAVQTAGTPVGPPN